jgi:hypothetical protein
MFTEKCTSSRRFKPATTIMLAGCICLFSCFQTPQTQQMPKLPEKLPSAVLNLTDWKITLPFDSNGKDGETSDVAAEVKHPQFGNYTLADYFYTNSTNDGVVFKAHAGGAHTKGSGFPRSELREMIENGKKSAQWQSNEGKHTMEIDQAITHLPIHKKHTVAGQIHSTGDFDDVITCRLEDKTLFLAHNGKKGTVLTEKYVMGTRFKIKWVVENNQIRSYYNNELVETYPLQFPDAYFKAGCYTQSASWGKNNNHAAEATEYSEVVIYNLSVSHQ